MGDDLVLVAAARSGDQSAFTELYRAHHRSAALHARRWVADHGEAEEVATLALALVFRAIERGGGPQVSFASYLMQAVRNLSVRELQRAKRRSEVSLGAVDEWADGSTVEDDIECCDLALRRAMACLPPRQRDALWRAEVDGFRPAELAAEMSTTPNAVAALLKRARTHLRRAYIPPAAT